MITTKKLLLPGAIGLMAFVGIAGGSLASSLSASAATSTTGSGSTTASTSTVTTAAATTQPDPSQGGHVGANGVKEVVLTGDTATKATAAAQAAVPGATVLRVENDAEGATYEAHMKKSDGSLVTVKMDASFKVTSTETGMGGGGRSPDSSSSSSTN